MRVSNGAVALLLSKDRMRLVEVELLSAMIKLRLLPLAQPGVLTISWTMTVSDGVVELAFAVPLVQAPIVDQLTELTVRERPEILFVPVVKVAEFAAASPCMVTLTVLAASLPLGVN